MADPGGSDAGASHAFTPRSWCSPAILERTVGLGGEARLMGFFRRASWTEREQNVGRDVPYYLGVIDTGRTMLLAAPQLSFPPRLPRRARLRSKDSTVGANITENFAGVPQFYRAGVTNARKSPV